MDFQTLVTDNGPLFLVVSGLTIGFVFGAIVARTNFCAMGSISDWIALGDTRRLRSWILAGAVAIIGTQLLSQLQVVELERAMYLTPTLNWLGHILGGLIFGIGMVFAAGCPSRNLVRAGGGDLRALLVLVFVGIFAYMTIGGIIGPLRAELSEATRIDLASLGYSTQGVGEITAGLGGAAPGSANLGIGLLIAGLMAAFCISHADFRASPKQILAGIGVGLCVVAGWAATGLAFDELADKPQVPISLTFARPAGDALEWLQRFTALGLPGFGVASVLGTLLGGFVVAHWTGRFRLSTFGDVGDTLRSLSGGALMGIGGVMALGCTIGQAVGGLATLALGSFITFAAIVAGGVIGIRLLERMLSR